MPGFTFEKFSSIRMKHWFLTLKNNLSLWGKQYNITEIYWWQFFLRFYITPVKGKQIKLYFTILMAQQCAKTNVIKHVWCLPKCQPKQHVWKNLMYFLYLWPEYAGHINSVLKKFLLPVSLSSTSHTYLVLDIFEIRIQ